MSVNNNADIVTAINALMITVENKSCSLITGIFILNIITYLNDMNANFITPNMSITNNPIVVHSNSLYPVLSNIFIVLFNTSNFIQYSS